MSMYDMYCDNKHKQTQYMTFAQYDEYDALSEDSYNCDRCGGILTVGVHPAALYGMMRCKDDAFADCSEATGLPISSTKDIDKLEKTGVVRAITNPSRARRFKDKK